MKAKNKKEEKVAETLRTFTRFLPCRLTEAEWKERSTKLGHVTQDIKNEEDHQKSVKEELKARLTKLQSDQHILSLQVTRWEEEREVEVVERLVKEGTGKMVAEIVRTDTGEVIETRPPTESERQKELL